MLRTNTALWRIAFLSGLGVLPAACGGGEDNASQRGEPDSTGQSATSGKHRPAPTGTPCVDSTPLSGLDGNEGLERCSDGRIHRPAATTCASRLPRPSAAAPAEPLPEGALCGADTECTEHPHGYCQAQFYGGESAPGPVMCHYGCVEDEDCVPGFHCQCGDPVGQCVPGNCRTDADCGDGLLCAQIFRPEEGTIGCGQQPEFLCEKPDDACRVSADCATSFCAVIDDARACAVYSAFTCGRPFLVEGSARLAPVERSRDWLSDALAPDGSDLSAAERAELAHAWAELGRMEHASVAAFARFTLQLLGVGAPATLVEQSQQALADELLHARLCFSLASRYAGEALGPGPLPTDHALDLTSLEDIVALTLHEGCVGETIAALEASEALALATDPAVCEVLLRIEADEQRHAALAWRFVRWALQHGGPRVQRRIQRELATLEAPAVATRPGLERLGPIAAHGILSATRRAELRDAALRDVVLPCARALLPAAGPAPLAVNI